MKLKGYTLLLLCLTACGRKPTYKDNKPPAVQKTPLLHLPPIPRATYNRRTHTLSWQSPASTHHGEVSQYAVYRYHTKGFIPAAPSFTVHASRTQVQLTPPLTDDERLAMRPHYKKDTSVYEGPLTLAT